MKSSRARRVFDLGETKANNLRDNVLGELGFKTRRPTGMLHKTLNV